eukprot:Gb_12166 [translate_table: standard]
MEPSMARKLLENSLTEFYLSECQDLVKLPTLSKGSRPCEPRLVCLLKFRAFVHLNTCAERIRRMIFLYAEYGVGGKVSSKGDVYSYGILLLEMFTRKWPINEMFEEDLNLHKWVRSAFPNGVVEVADSCLFTGAGREETEENEPNFKQCLNSLLHVGLLCTKESPQERSTMRDVGFLIARVVPLPHHKAPTFGIHSDLSAILEQKKKFKLDAFDEFSSGAASMLSFRVFADSHLFAQCSGWIISILITMIRP